MSSVLEVLGSSRWKDKFPTTINIQRQQSSQPAQQRSFPTSVPVQPSCYLDKMWESGNSTHSSISSGSTRRGDEEQALPSGTRGHFGVGGRAPSQDAAGSVGQSTNASVGMRRQEHQSPISKPFADANGGDLPTTFGWLRETGTRVLCSAVGYVLGAFKREDSLQDAQPTQDADKISKLERAVSDYRRQIKELEERCEVQSKDLETSNGYLNAADKSSDTDITRAIDKLNAEVQQIATHMAECLIEDLKFGNITANLTRQKTGAIHRATEHIGETLVGSLQTATKEESPLLLQIAFQAYLASVVYQTISSWTSERGNNKFVSEIYERLREGEPQAVSGRWRSLTHCYVDRNGADIAAYSSRIVEGLSDILVAARCTTAPSDIISQVTSKFEDKIALLVDLSRRLNESFNEVISGDFEAFIVRPGDVFNGESMEEDSDDGQVKTHGGRVLCVTHLGLIKQMPLEGSLWERGSRRKMLVLKAKVLLESFLAAG